MAKKNGGPAKTAAKSEPEAVQVTKPHLFQKGKSGNPNGRPQGSRNSASLLVEQLIDDEAETLTRKAIEMAKEGNAIALKVVFERLAPVRRERPVHFEAPDLRKPEDAMQAIGAIVRGVADGMLTVQEASGIANIVATFIKARESADHEQRIAKLEEARQAQQSPTRPAR